MSTYLTDFPTLVLGQVMHQERGSGLKSEPDSKVMSGQQPKWLPRGEWINKMCCTRAMECYSALKRKDILTHATMWVNLEDIMLSESASHLEGKYCMIALIWGTWSRQIHTHRKWNGGCQGLGRGSGKLLFDGCRVSVLQDEKSSWMDGWWWWFHNSVNILNATELYT